MSEAVRKRDELEREVASEVGEEKPALAPAPAPATRDDVRVKASPTRCPFCHDDIRQPQEWVACAGCLARHHRSCWGEAKACASCGDKQHLLGGGVPRSTWLPLLAVSLMAVMAAMFLAAGVSFARVQASLQRATEDMKRVAEKVEKGADGREDPSRRLPGETPPVTELRLKAEAGDRDAAYRVARALEKGEGVAPSVELARTWLEKAAELGSAKAMTEHAFWLWFSGKDAEGDRKALYWYQRAADAGDSAALFEAAYVTIEVRHEIATARPFLERAANAGDARAMLALAHLQREPEGEWAKKAHELFRAKKAAGIRELAMILCAGRIELAFEATGEKFQLTVAKDQDEAWKLAQEAAEAGDVRAQAFVGDALVAGRTSGTFQGDDFAVPQDRAKGEALLRKACDAGSVEAMLALATSLKNPSYSLAEMSSEQFQAREKEAVGLVRRAWRAKEATDDQRRSARETLEELLEKHTDLAQPGDPTLPRDH